MILRHNSTVWTPDKDGPMMDLAAVEITAHTGTDTGDHFRDPTAKFSAPYCTCNDATSTRGQMAKLGELSRDAVRESSLAGEPINVKLTRVPGNNASIGGLKVAAGRGWFAAAPLCT